MFVHTSACGERAACSKPCQQVRFGHHLPRRARAPVGNSCWWQPVGEGGEQPHPDGLLQGARRLSPQKCQLFTLKPMPVRKGCDEILRLSSLPRGQGGRNSDALPSPAPGVTVACHRGPGERHAGKLPGQFSPGAGSPRLPRQGPCLAVCGERAVTLRFPGPAGSQTSPPHQGVGGEPKVGTSTRG